MVTFDLSATHTIIDVAKTHNNKEQLDIAQVLHKKNGLFRVGSWEEANQLTTHVYSKEKSLPAGTWRSVNEGIAPSNAQTEQGLETLGRLEDKSIIDEYLIDDVVPNPKEYRYQHDLMHMEGLTQTAVSAFLYGNPATDMNKPKGLQVRYNATTLPNVHSMGDATSSKVTSVYVCQFGAQKMNLLYGRSSANKIVNMEDMGKELVPTSVTVAGTGYYGYVTKFNMIMGNVVYDDRAVQRICNIGTGGSNELSIDSLIWALDSLPDPEDVSGTVIFCNRLTRYQLNKALRNRPNLITSSKDEYGNYVEFFKGARIVLLEGIVNTESVVA